MKSTEFFNRDENREMDLSHSLALKPVQRLVFLENMMRLGQTSGIDQAIFNEREYIILRKK